MHASSKVAIRLVSFPLRPTQHTEPADAWLAHVMSVWSAAMPLLLLFPFRQGRWRGKCLFNQLLRIHYRGSWPSSLAMRRSGGMFPCSPTLLKVHFRAPRFAVVNARGASSTCQQVLMKNFDAKGLVATNHVPPPLTTTMTLHI